jgi:hypothetical protein
MLGQVSPEEQARFIAGDGPIGDALAAFGRSLARGASSKDGQIEGMEE